jgi:hypothetical protein
VVIDGYRRPIITRYESSNNDGIAGRANPLRLRTKGAQKLNCRVCATLDVGFVFRFCANRGYLNPLFESRLKIGATGFSVVSDIGLHPGII